MKQKLLLTFALLLTAATGAWADDWYKVQVTVSGTIGTDPIPEQSFTQYSTLPYAKTLGECYQAVKGEEPPAGLNVSSVALTSGTNVTIGAVNNWATPITITAAGNATVTTSLTPAGTVYFAIAVTQVTSWESGACTVLKDGSSLIVRKTDPSSETGAMDNYYDNQPWKDVLASITSLVIGSGVTHIGDYAFINSGVTSITIPASVTSIGQQAFDGCASLATVTFAAGSQLETIVDGAFQNSGLTSIEIPANVSVINSSTFSECSSLQTVTFATGSLLTTIEFLAFYGCTNLSAITIPDGVTTIGNSAFSGCTGLLAINIPDGVTSIGDGAFLDCSNLATVTLNSNPYIGYYAFQGIKDGATVTMNLTANTAGGANWMTFYNQHYNFQADENTQVFKAELDETNGTLTLHEVTNRIVDATVPVVLKSSGNPVMTLTTSSSGDTQDNDLWGVSDLAGETAPDPSGMFVLNTGSAGVGFYRLTPGKTLGLGKAYLQYLGVLSSNFFGFEDDETTGLKSIDNGQLKMDNYYDLSGRKVANPKKGLYIVNGKKVIKR